MVPLLTSMTQTMTSLAVISSDDVTAQERDLAPGLHCRRRSLPTLRAPSFFCTPSSS